MKFSEKLKKAMDDLGINQSKVVALTGKSKSSISQYLSDKHIPSVEAQKEIAVSLGLPFDYFEDGADFKITYRNNPINRISPKEAAKFLGMNHNTVRLGLQQGVFPWGYAIRTSENRWVYFINAKRFAEIEGITG